MGPPLQFVLKVTGGVANNGSENVTYHEAGQL